uniref:C-type lectin domain-containing protein n=1 Tax=Gouania willdenowi TaxID=441366 RepID=A0A8C5G772_GOUWI
QEFPFPHRPTLCVCVCVCARVCDDCIKVDGTMSTAVGPENTILMLQQPMFLLFPAGWLLFKDKCFIFKGKENDIKGSWIFARDWCKEQGGTLAIIDNQHENSELILLPVLPTWIGLSDLLVENQYAWSDGVSPVLFTNWNDKEPNNAGGSENCVEMYHDGHWNDNNCLQKRGFVCKHRQCKHLQNTFSAGFIKCKKKNYSPIYHNSSIASIHKMFKVKI